MNHVGARHPGHLAQQEGWLLLSAHDAIVKGILEAETAVAFIACPQHGGLARVFDLCQQPEVEAVLREHGIRVIAVSHSGRAVTLAGHVARSGRAACVMIPNDQLDETVDDISAIRAQALDRGGALSLVLEDDPQSCPPACPRQAARRLRLPCVEPGDVSQLRDAMEDGLRLSRAGQCPAAIVVHTSVLRTADTIEVRANRVSRVPSVIEASRKRHRSVRWSEMGSPLRIARRLELNQFRALPNPGERVGVGFITVGPANVSLHHLIHVLGLHGRVPVLQLGLINPVDESAVGRLLSRCQHVVVLEPRPGVVESSVLAVTEALRRRGEQPASVWGRELPPDGQGVVNTMDSDDDLHPSILVRKIAHLLHGIRPGLQVASHLLPDPPALAMAVPTREGHIGVRAARAVVRRMVTDVDQWLRDRAPLEERGIQPTALAIDGAEAGGEPSRIVQVETWEHNHFVRDGLAALVQAVSDTQPWMFLICEDASAEIRDLVRLSSGAIPEAFTDRVVVQTANLSNRVALRDVIRDASLEDRVTVIVVKDGPPPQYDVRAIEQALGEIDRLGFEPRQRVIRAVSDACSFHSEAEESEPDDQVEHGPSPLKPAINVERIHSRVSTGFYWRVRPLMEEVEVVRVRPPFPGRRETEAARPPMPQPIHARHPQWRMHIAGYRGEPPGVLTLLISEAGRIMGYHVRSIHHPGSVGAGRRAWSQVLFTRPRRPDQQPPITSVIPYGEADVLLGLDVNETLRAISADRSLRVASPDRTYVVANTGLFSDERLPEDQRVSEAQILGAISGVSQPKPRLLQDIAQACRTWFHTDRVADVVLLGAAYQAGLVPISLDAMSSAVRMVESRGFGRVWEAFEFGRRLGADDRVAEPSLDRSDHDVDRLLRRMALSLQRSRLVRIGASEFSALLRHSLESLPGLAETDAGRQSREVFVKAMYRCLAWGGVDYARQYASLIIRLYQSDRGDRGRALTRFAVLPLAEAMLIRDPFYLAMMIVSPEHRRATRRKLNVKHARGDRMERRYLTRFDCVAFHRRIRAELYTSAWPAHVMAALGHIVPGRWRGTKRERLLRDFLIETVGRAIDGASHDYERWYGILRRLHAQAAENRLRDMALAELKMLIESAPADAALSAVDARPSGAEM